MRSGRAPVDSASGIHRSRLTKIVAPIPRCWRDRIKNGAQIIVSNCFRKSAPEARSKAIAAEKYYMARQKNFKAQPTLRLCTAGIQRAALRVPFFLPRMAFSKHGGNAFSESA
jgi:hypothetical protein